MRAAAGLRVLADRLAELELPASALDDVARRLAAVTDGLPTPDPATGTWYRRSMASGRAVDRAAAVAAQLAHPLSSGRSGVYPVIRAEVGERRLVADVDFTAAYEGPPGLVHGGFLAAGFDMVLSHLALVVLDHSVTRWLRLRYLAPTFLGRGPVRYEVEAQEPVGRTVALAGRLVDAGGRVTMKATAEFASVDLDRYRDRRATAEG